MYAFVKTIFVSPEWQLLTALSIGLLIGAERERHKGSGPTRAPAGLRTFALVALLGGVAAQTGSAAVTVLSGAFVGAGALLAYALGNRSDPGLTTEVALVATFALGYLTRLQAGLALATGVVVAALLAVRNPLHRFVRDILTEQEVNDGLAFFIAAAVVLPMLPDRALDPLGLFNLHELWRLAVVLMGLNGLGHGAVRFFGPRLGLLAAGIGSGFLSSSAAIATMGARARKDASSIASTSAGAVASLVGSMAYLLALVFAADPGLFRQLGFPVGLAVAATSLYCVLLFRRSPPGEGLQPESGRAFNVKTVLVFAFLVGFFSVLSAALMLWIGNRGLFAGAIVTGIADAHAAAVSTATLVAAGKTNSFLGGLAILCALSANMTAKAPLAFATGPRGFGARVTAGLIILLVALWAGYFWNSAVG